MRGNLNTCGESFGREVFRHHTIHSPIGQLEWLFRVSLVSRDGARVVRERRDRASDEWKLRLHKKEDPEGHHWYFAKHVRDVAPEDMKPFM